MKKTLFSVTAITSLLCVTVSSHAQISYSGGTHTENFDWTSGAATQTVAWTSNNATQPFVAPVSWVGNSTGWYAGGGTADSTNIRAGNGNNGNNAGIDINNYFFNNTDSDRSFGGRPTSLVPLNIAMRLTNTSTNTYTDLTLSYRLEVTSWRGGGSNPTVQVSYLIGNPSNWRTDPFTAAPTWDLATLYSGPPATTVTNVDGNAAGNFNTLTATTITGVSWAPGQDLWIRWQVPAGGGGLYPNIGLDDVSFTATVIPEPTTWALLAGCIAALLISRRRRKA